MRVLVVGDDPQKIKDTETIISRPLRILKEAETGSISEAMGLAAEFQMQIESKEFNPHNIENVHIELDFGSLRAAQEFLHSSRQLAYVPYTQRVSEHFLSRQSAVVLEDFKIYVEEIKREEDAHSSVQVSDKLDQPALDYGSQ